MPKPTLLAAQIHAAIAAQAAGRAVATIPGRMEVRAAADGSDEAELLIYGDIGDNWWTESVAASDVVRQLAEITAGTINVRVNSYGGSVADGTAIYNALKRHPATINTSVEGVAASIASLITMAGDNVAMPANTLLMVHAPWAYAVGNSTDLREMADVLDVYARAMATSYAAKSGRPYDEMLALLTDGKDHWYTAAEAKDAGLVDTVVEDAAATDAAAAALAKVAAQSSFAPYARNAPAAIAAALRLPNAATPPAAPSAAAVATPSPAAAGATLPAASAAGSQQEPTMTNPANPAAAPSPAATDPNAAVAAAMAALAERNTAVLAAARPHAGNAQMVQLRDEVLADPNATLADFNARALAILGAQAAPAAGAHTPNGGDEADKRREAMAQALGARAGVPDAKADGANPYRGMPMSAMARACAEAAGVNVRGMDSLQIVQAAVTTTSSDFPLLLGNVVRRSVMQGYEAAEEIFPLITQAVSVPDFRKSSLAALGHFSGISVVKEGGEYKYGQFDELGTEVQLAKAGAKFALTHEAIVNDDLSQLSLVPRKMGEAAKTEVGDRVFALLTGNPQLGDGVALFHADHNNIVVGSAITTATVDGVRVLMATQKTPSGKTIRVRLKYLVVPVGKGGVARTVQTSEFEVGADRKSTTPNYVRNGFEVLEDPRLDAANPNAWYGIADPGAVALIAVAYRDGKQEPTVEQKDGWDVDGIEFKVRMEAAPAVADYRGGAYNPGA
jgi:ATP-dependent protease ClpP protease subunit